MTITKDAVVGFLVEELSSMKEDGRAAGDSFGSETALVGNGASVDSRGLVEILLATEDFVDEHFGLQFDWQSDKAMSATRSPFRTVGTLAAFVVEEAEE